MKVQKPTIEGIVTLFQGLFALLVGSCILMAFILAFCTLFEVLFKIKLI